MPDLDELSKELLEIHKKNVQSSSDDDGFPTTGDVNEFAKKYNVTPSGEQTQVMNDMTSALSDSTSIPVIPIVPTMEAPGNPPLAAKALAASISATNGDMLAPGLDIQGFLNFNVYDKVTAEFQNSYFKNTFGTVTYHHTADVNIEAADVRLTASSVHINASEEERNTVSSSKLSIRYLNNLSFGSYSTQYTEGHLISGTGINFDVSGVNNSAVAVRAAYSQKATNSARIRGGLKALNLEFSKSADLAGGSPNVLRRVAFEIIL